MESLIVFVVLWWFGAVFLTAWLAQEKERSGVAWSLLALFFGVIALLALIGAPTKKAEFTKEAKYGF